MMSFPHRWRWLGCLAAVVLQLPVQAQETTSLKQAYGNFAIGTAIGDPKTLTPQELAILKANFTTITPEGCMKPKQTEPEENKYTFDEADAYVNFAHENGLTVNGHCLVWNKNPDWIFLDNGKAASRDVVLKRMIDHVTTEVSHLKGKVFSWDVVNEALGGPTYLKPTQWWTSIGDDYIAEAFKAAAQADPQAQLYYNDYGIESPGKRERALRLIRDLKKQNIRIDGIGIQGHWSLDRIPFKDIEDSIVAFHQAGVAVMITELDLDMVPRKQKSADVDATEKSGSDPYATGCPPEVLQREAAQYAQLFALFRKHADMISRVTLWGLDDGRSWLNSWPRERTNYPLLWDRNLQPKPALAAILAVAKK